MATEEKEQVQQLVDPFSGLNIDSHTTLECIKGRSHCPNCNASRKYFCYNCIIPMPEVSTHLRTISLPIQVDIIKHPKEIDGKSTAIHAAIIAPGDVKLYTYPCIPHYEDKSKVLLVYPSKNAVTLKELFQKHSSTQTKPSGTHSEHHRPPDVVTPPDPKRTRLDVAEESAASCKQAFDRVVFIDSTWNQSNQIYRDERLKDLQCIILNSKKTHFWRTQHDKPDTYLATIEAIYYFLLEYHREVLQETEDYQGQYDNLLYFYSFMYRLVQQSTADRENEERTLAEKALAEKALMKERGDGGDGKEVELKE